MLVFRRPGIMFDHSTHRVYRLAAIFYRGIETLVGVPLQPHNGNSLDMLASGPVRREHTGFASPSGVGSAKLPANDVAMIAGPHAVLRCVCIQISCLQKAIESVLMQSHDEVRRAPQKPWCNGRSSHIDGSLQRDGEQHVINK